jgi:hypothetical protein
VAVGGTGTGNAPAGGVQVGYGNDAQGTNTDGTTGTGGSATPPAGNAPQITIPPGYVDPYAAASGKMAGGVSSQMESRMPGALAVL